MQRLGVVVVCAAVCAGMLTSRQGLAASSESTTGEVLKATTLSYDVELALVDLDTLVRPGATPTTGASQPRTLGLRDAKVALGWQAPGGAGLRLLLRPDAVNRAEGGQSPAREFDDRSGDPGLQQEPTIRLADAYQVTYEASPYLGAAVGVFEGLTPSQAAYPEVLGFGMLPLFPAKFSGVRLTWRRPEIVPETADTAGSLARAASFSASAYVFQGNEDRAETLAGSTQSYDTGPTANDPYHGGAIDLAWMPSAKLGFGLLVGNETTTASDQAVNDARHDDVFARLTGTARFPAFGREGKLGLDVRYLRNQGTGGVADRQALAGILTASLPASTGVWGLLGAGFGKGDRWVWGDQTRSGTVPLTGYQLEAGALAALAPELALEFLVTHEFRQIRDATGQLTGGFFGGQGPGSPGNRTVLQRLGLQLTYRLNQNA